MRVALASTHEKGHLNPLVGVAQHLLARSGVAVGWACLPTLPEFLRDMAVRPIDVVLPPRPLVTGGHELARLVRDPPALKAWIGALLVDFVPERIEPFRTALQAFQPDVLAVDPMLYPAIIAAFQLGIPWIGVSSSLNPAIEGLECDLTRTLDGLGADRAALFRRHGLEPEFRVADHLSPYLTTVFSTAEYLRPVALPPRVELVGPSRPMGARGDEVAFDWDRLGSRPLIYASFGSQIAYQPRLFQLLVDASAGLGVNLVLSCGDLATTDWARHLPPHVIALPYAPQRALLERAAVFVTHGGANSAMEALSRAVPMLIIPICNDQPLQAAVATRRGVALSVPEPEPESLRAALEHLLSPPDTMTRALAEVAQSYRCHDGAAIVAQRLLGLAGGDSR